MSTASLPSPAPPSDATNVVTALRLGWALAEVRGRLRGDALGMREAPVKPPREAHSLPLWPERSPLELLIESETVVEATATVLGVDVDCSELTGQTHAQGKASERLVDLAMTLNRTRRAGGDATAAWNELREFFYAWDAKIQDRLAGASYTEVSAYQLGRGLGEIRWTVDPSSGDAEAARVSSVFLLGPERVKTLRGFLTRLSAYFALGTAHGIAESLTLWGGWIADESLRADERTWDALLEQSRRWRDLLVTGLDPRTLIPRSRALRRVELRTIVPVLRSFLPEAAGAALGVLVIIGAAVFLAFWGNKWIGAALGFLGVTSISVSGLLAKARDNAQAILVRFRAVFALELIAEAILCRPPGATPPDAS